MKKILVVLGVVCTMALQMAAQTVDVSGRITDAGTGGSFVNHAVEVVLYDSLTSTIVTQAQVFTDTAGYYHYSFSTANGPLSGNGEVNVVDCNGAIHSLHFLFVNGSANHTNFDFAICGVPGGCSAAFVGSHPNGGFTVHFYDQTTSSNGAVVNWAWDFGDGTFGSFANLSHSYAAAGSYLVCLTITTSGGCVSTFCDSVSAGVGTVSCSANLAYGIFPSGAYGFMASAAGSGQPVGYEYDFGDGNSLSTNQDSVLHTYANSGSYMACVTVLFSDSCFATACTTVNAGVGNCQADFFAVPDTSGQYSLLLVNNSMGAGLSYLWDFGDGGTSALAYPQHTYPGPGTYYICLSVWDSTNTCSSTFCDSIVVIQKLGAAFTVQVVPALLTGNPAMVPVEAHMVLLPNPVADLLHVQMELLRAGKVSWTVMDLHGRAVSGAAVGLLGAGVQQVIVNVADLPAGMYLLRVDGGLNGTWTERLLIAR